MFRSLRSGYSILMMLAVLSIATVSLADPEGEVSKADEQYALGNYREALALFQEMKSNDPAVQEKIANCFYYLNEYENAETQLARVVDEKGVDINTVLHYAEVLMNQKKYDKAAEVFKRYKEDGGKVDVESKIASCTWATEHANDRPDFGLSTLNLQTGGRSLGVAIYKEGLIYAVPQAQTYEDETVYYDLAYAKKQDSVTFSKPEMLSKGLNTKFYEGSPSVSADGKYLYFTRNASAKDEVNVKKKKKNNISEEGVNVLQLLVAENVNNVWQNIKLVSINSIDYSCTHPCISPDGSTLYFVSNMPGGHGGYDVYKMEKKGTGWGQPENLGKNVNSSQNEMFPYFKDGVLYLASNGHVGFGGYDLYKVETKDGVPSGDALNLGTGINTSKDDFAIVFNADGKSGYVSSNREGDNGGDKIFSFEKIVYPFTVEGLVKDKVSFKPIKDVKVEILPSGSKSLETKYTDTQGLLSFMLYPDRDYTLTFSKEGYEPKVVQIPAGTAEDKIIAMLGNIELEVEAKKDVVINLDNIYFALAQAEPMPESLPILDRLITFMNDHPEIKIELSAHTDSRGGDAYNNTLSDQRAKACYNYLIVNDIDAKRIVPKGYGESKPLNRCKDGVQCSEEEYQINRRVEIKIL